MQNDYEGPAKIRDIQTHDLLSGTHERWGGSIIAAQRSGGLQLPPILLKAQHYSAAAGAESVGHWASKRATASKPKEAAPCMLWCQTRNLHTVHLIGEAPLHIADRLYTRELAVYVA